MAIAILTGPAYAQFNMGGGEQRDRTRYTEEEKRREKESERAYNDTVKATRGAASESFDPWRSIRPSAPEKKSSAR